jgi:hypothetical protein
MSCMRMGSGGMEHGTTMSAGNREGWRQGHWWSLPMRATGHEHELFPLLRVEPYNFTGWMEATSRCLLGADVWALASRF